MRRNNRVMGFWVAMTVLSLAACGEVPGVQEASKDAEIRTEEDGGQTGGEDEAGRDADENLSTEENPGAEENSGTEEKPGAEENSSTEEISKMKKEPADVQAGSFNAAANIEETVIINENDIKITATELKYTDSSVKLNLLIENNSNTNLSFISGSMGYNCNSVNGYMVGDGYLNADIAAGKKSHESISFSRDMLAVYGITEIADIQIGVYVKDEDYEEFYTGMGQIKTSGADSYDYEDNSYQKSVKSGIWETVYNCSIDYYAEEELYHQNDVRVVSETLMTNKDGEKVVLIEVENNSQEMIYGVTSDIMVNGLMLKGARWSSESISPGCRRIIDLSIASMLDKAYWPVFGIEDIGEFVFSFAIENADHEKVAAAEEIRIGVSEEAAVDDSGEEFYSNNGIRIISKGLFADSSKYSDDIHLMLLAENQSSEAVSIDVDYGSLSVNGFMTDYSCYRGEAAPGKYVVIDVQMRASSLEENKIAEIEEISNIEITLEIRDSQYDIIDNPTLSIEY